MQRAAAVIAAVFVGLFVLGSAGTASPAQLSDGCTKERGTVTCTSFEGPGNNQGGVGTTTVDETQGNETNTSPAESQDLESTCTARPAKSQGAPNTCP